MSAATVKLSNLNLAAGALVLSALTVAATIAIAAPTADHYQGVVTSWNAAVGSIEAEDSKFRELLDSYQRNPPGRVLVVPDVRAEQKKRRLRLISEIISSHEERIRTLRDLAKFEQASP